MRLGHRITLCILSLFPLIALGAPTTTLQVDIGWGNRARQGVWTPIFVTVSDTQTRNAYLELYTPHDLSAAMSIRMPIALNSRSQTYALFAPLLAYNDPPRLKVVDADTGKLLAEYLMDPNDQSFQSRDLFDTGDGIVIGVSGRGRAMEQLQLNPSVSPDNSLVLYLPPALLPRTAKGFDSLGILALNQPDFSQLETAQQNAICDWVRSGGRLVLWPGETPVPPNSPLVKILPCKIGDVIAVNVSPTGLRSENLPSRFAQFKGRMLEAREGAVTYKILGDNGRVVRDRVGLGEIIVVSFDVSGLDFTGGQNSAKNFWSKILDPAYTGVGSASSMWMRSASKSSGFQIQDSQRSAGAAQVMDLLGNVPGVGTFGFGYVATVLLGMMVIVGPIDWFVLKRLGRQPWTWVTTLGWIGLLTTGALFMGYAFRSGDLHQRTIRVIDQADDQVVSRLDVVGIYSPRTSDYKLETRPGSWWEPLTSSEMGYGRAGVVTAIPFRQDGRANSGNVPQEMTINVWNLRFLLGETIAPDEPVIGASIEWGILHSSTPNTYQPRVIGTITNRSDAPLMGLWLRSRQGLYDLATQPAFPTGGLAPGASFTIDVVLADNHGWTDTSKSNASPIYNRYGRTHISVDAMTPLDIVKAACELPSRQSRQIDTIIANSKFTRQTKSRNAVVIYALSETPVPAAKLLDQKPLEKHWQVLRAIVELKQSSNTE